MKSYMNSTLFSGSKKCILTGCFMLYFLQQVTAGDPKRDALMSAIDNRNVDEIGKLINDGVNINFYDKAYVWGTPLLKAIASRHDEIVLMLINAGANVNLKGEGDYTPLYYAISNCSEDVIDLMLKKKANVNQYVDGYTPLHQALKRGNYRVLKLLLDAGANINLETKNADELQPYNPLRIAKMADSAMCVYLFSLNYPKQWTDNVSPNVLFEGARNGNACMVKTALKAGFKPEDMNEQGYSPIHLAAKIYNQGMAVNTLQAFLENGVGINMQNKEGKTSLDLAAEEVRHDLVWSFLAKNGAKFNHTASYNKMDEYLADATYDNLWNDRKHYVNNILEYHLYYSLHKFLQRAVEEKNTEALHLALKYKADVSRPDYNSNTVLYYALKMSDSLAYSSILESQSPEKRAELNTKALRDFIQKAKQPWERQMSWALAWPLNPDELSNDNGNQHSLLHIVAGKADSACIVDMVNRYKGNPLVKDKYGRNTYDILASSGKTNVIEALLNSQERIMELDTAALAGIAKKAISSPGQDQFVLNILKAKTLRSKDYSDLFNSATDEKKENMVLFLESYLVKYVPLSERKPLLINAALVLDNGVLFNRYFDPRIPVKEIDSLFLTAVHSHCSNIVKNLVKYKPNLNDTDKYGHTLAYNLLVYNADLTACRILQQNGGYAFIKNNLRSDTMAVNLLFPVLRYKSIRKSWPEVANSSFQENFRESQARFLLFDTDYAFRVYAPFVDVKNKDYSLSRTDLDIALGLAKSSDKNADKIFSFTEKALLTLLKMPRTGVPEEVEDMLKKEIMVSQL